MSGVTIMNAAGIPYHRLARTAAHRWWRPLLGTLALPVFGFAGFLAVYFAVEAAGVIARRPADADGWHSFGVAADLGQYLLAEGLFVLWVLLAARWVQARPAGTVSSVLGRLRWRWLGVCLLVAVPTLILMQAGAELLFRASGDAGAADDGHWVGAGDFVTAMLLLIVVVPLDAAAQEYVFRGWLLQAVGAFVRTPWPPIAVQAVLFAAVHGWGTPWGFADLILFGAVLGWLAVRTGGLEAGIALHVVVNLAALGFSAAYGELASGETMADAQWQFFAVDVVLMLAYAATVAGLARRRRLVTLAPAAATPEPVPQPA